MSLVKQDIVKKIVDNIGLKQNEAIALVDSFFADIKTGLIDNGQVKISGFGNFNLLEKSERTGRNPKTKEIFPISARTVVSFRAGVKLKAIVQQKSLLES